MKSFIFKLREEEIELRLNSIDCERIEKTYNCTLIDYVQQGSITSLVTLLQYMRSGTGKAFTRNMAYSFYDELVDEGYTIETILMELIYPTLVVSGILSQEDLDNIMEERKKINEMSDEDKMKLIQERKNVKS